MNEDNPRPNTTSDSQCANEHLTSFFRWWWKAFTALVTLLSVVLPSGASAMMTDDALFGVVAQTAAHEPCVVLQSPVQVGQLITIAKLRPAEYVAATATKPTAACGIGLEPGYSYELAIPAGQTSWWASTAVIGKVPPGLKFKECYGTESVHLSVWRGSKRIWRGYYYVDYEMEPSCTAKDLAE